MLFSTLLASGIIASVSALPTTKDLIVRQERKVARTDVYISTQSVMTGDQDPYWTYHQAYDLCGKTSCMEDGTKKEYTVKAPVSGGLNHQAGEGTLTVTATGTYSNADPADWKERNGLIETLANAIKAASAQKDYTIQVGVGCSPKAEFCNSEPDFYTVKYWEAPAWAKAVILDEHGNAMGDMSVKVEFHAQQFDPLGIFSCDNAKGAVEVAMDAFRRSSPYAGVLGLAGDIFCASVSP